MYFNTFMFGDKHTIDENIEYLLDKILLQKEDIQIYHHSFSKSEQYHTIIQVLCIKNNDYKYIFILENSLNLKLKYSVFHH